MGVIWSKSGSIERDANDNRCVAATAEFFVGGTTTPLTVYQDAAEATPHEESVEADGAGRWPFVSIPYCESYDVQVSTAGGTQLYYYREIPNPNPVEAAADTIDDTQLIQTGDIIFAPKTGTRSGFVRVNGRTIGSASSGATERANADTEDLYTYNWNNFADGICAVSGGRGGSAAADFAANKPIALLDGRSGVLRGVDDMGNSAGSFLTLATFTTGNATTGGSIAGVNTHTLTDAQVPAHTHSFSATTGSNGAHTHTVNVSDPGHFHNTGQAFTANGVQGTGGNAAGTQDAVNGTVTQTKTTGITATTVSDGAHTHSVSGTSGSFGSGTAHNNVSRSILGNHLQKL